MPPQIIFTEVSTLPRFAWAAVYHPADRVLRAYHGSGVETCEKGIVEGAWNGEFSDFNFHQSTVFSGTGFIEDNGDLLFCSSTDTMAPLFSIRMEGRLIISNSAIFAMSLAGVRPHPDYPFYNCDINRIYRGGLHIPAGEIRLADGHTLRMHVAAIVAVAPDGRIDYRTHPPGEKPDDFTHYHRILTEGVSRLLENGRDARRKIPLGSAAAISTGYDSCTTAALARAGGCQEAHTFYDTRTEHPRADSGAGNAAALGMECREYDRWAYLKSSRPVEAEFALTSAGSNATHVAMEDDLRNKIYIVGSHGEIPWGLTRCAHFDQLSGLWRRSISNIGQIEYRLRIGYIVFAPALIALRHNRAIDRISHSNEMQAWSVGGEYDRPIARRICEEAGIPREKFGFKKYSCGHSNLKTGDSFSAVGYESYSAFLTQKNREAAFLKRCYWKARFKCSFFVYCKLTSTQRKSVRSIRLSRKFPFILNAPPQRYPWKYAFTFQWAFDELRDRYQI